MVTILFSHPWHGSFNKSILDIITDKYDKEGTPYQVIDLNKDEFNPVMTETELALYSTGGYIDPLVGKYQEILRKTTKLIIMYPVWWSRPPAIMLGFFDKVMLRDFAFNYQNGWTPLLDSIEQAIVITTSEQPTSSLAEAVNSFVTTSLKPMGITNSSWFNCERVSSGTDADRKAFLNTIEENV